MELLFSLGMTNFGGKIAALWAHFCLIFASQTPTTSTTPSHILSPKLSKTAVYRLRKYPMPEAGISPHGKVENACRAHLMCCLLCLGIIISQALLCWLFFNAFK